MPCIDTKKGSERSAVCVKSSAHCASTVRAARSSTVIPPSVSADQRRRNNPLEWCLFERLVEIPDRQARAGVWHAAKDRSHAWSDHERRHADSLEVTELDDHWRRARQKVRALDVGGGNQAARVTRDQFS